jgi:hypothetical protein
MVGEWLAAFGPTLIDNRPTRGPRERDRVLIQDDMTAKLLVTGRLAPGTTGESRRVTHVFEVDAGSSGARVLARCGEKLPRADVEWVAPGTGMPCERCLGLTGADQPRYPQPELGV